MRQSRSVRLTMVVVFALAVGAVATGAGANAGSTAQAQFPSLRLVGTEAETSDVRPEGAPAFIETHTFVAAVGGAFEIHANKRPDGRVIAQQVARDANGEIVERRRLPRWAMSDITQGFDEFFEVIVRDGAGQVVATPTAPFCPASWDRARVDDAGPDVPTYVFGCWASDLTTGMVWGIESGWASRAPESWWVTADVPDGTYQVDIEIARKFRGLFRIPANQGKVSMTLTVTTGDDFEGDVATESPPPPFGDSHAASTGRDQPVEVAATANGLPDLIALPPFTIMAATPEDPLSEGGDGLIFSANVWNGGDGPLVLEGFRRLGQPVMDAYQYFYENGVNTGRELVGELEYDSLPGHRHWHFTDFAEYRLIQDDGTEVARSGKEAFCLAPTDPIDLTLPNAEYNPHAGDVTTRCGAWGALWIREVLEVGWGDTYFQGVPGQWIEITDVANGEYLLEVATNQDGRLKELRSDNNVAHTRVVLGGEPGARTVEVVDG